jgi:hypothetical protein
VTGTEQPDAPENWHTDALADAQDQAYGWAETADTHQLAEDHRTDATWNAQRTTDAVRMARMWAHVAQALTVQPHEG